MPSRNTAAKASGAPSQGSRPSQAQSAQAAYIPSIRNSAWAKFTTPITPKTSVRPTEIRA